MGDELFLVASFLTAGYTVMMRKSKLDPVHVTALVATGSLVVYAPLYFGVRGLHLAQVPVDDLTIQMIFQGIVVTIISLVLTAERFSFWGLRVARPSARWYPRCRRCLPYLSWANGRQHQVGWASFSYRPVCTSSGGPLPAMRHASSTMPRVAITTGTRNPFAFHRFKRSQ
jgi:hypothetical protein